SPRLWLTRIEDAKLMDDCALICPILPRETRVYDCDRLLCVKVIDRKVAAFQNLQTNCGKVIVRHRFEVPAGTIPIGHVRLAVDLVLALTGERHAEAICECRSIELRIGTKLPLSTLEKLALHIVRW